MTRYERRVISLDQDGGFDVEGRVVSVLDSPKGGRNTVTALVEVPETIPPATFEDDSEGVDEERLAEGYRKAAERYSDDDVPIYEVGEEEPVDSVPRKATFFCGAPKANDEPCEREVDQPGETCWQHPETDE